MQNGRCSIGDEKVGAVVEGGEQMEGQRMETFGPLL